MARPKAHTCNGPTSCKLCRDNLNRKRRYAESAKERAKRIEASRKRRQVCKEEVNAADRKRWHENEGRREASKLANVNYYHKNKEASRIYGRAKYHRNKHKGTYTANTAKRRAAKLTATPLWLTGQHVEQIKLFYEAAASYQAHVDHITPLLGKDVCGLHVPWNLQVLDSETNLSKGNKLTTESEQLAWTPKLNT